MSIASITRYKHDKAHPFVAINTEVAKALSIEQLGLLVKMLAFGKGWDISDERLRKEYNVKPAEASRVRMQLSGLGHLKIERQTDAKTKKYKGKAEWQIIEYPQCHEPTNGVVAQESTSHEPKSHGVEIEMPHGENASLLNPIPNIPLEIPISQGIGDYVAPHIDVPEPPPAPPIVVEAVATTPPPKAFDFDSLSPDEKQAYIDKLTSLTGTLVDAEGRKKDRDAARIELNALKTAVAS